MPTQLTSLKNVHFTPTLKAIIGISVAGGALAGLVLAAGAFLLFSGPRPASPSHAQTPPLQPIAPDPAPAPRSDEASILLGDTIQNDGLDLIIEGDGMVTMETLDGVACVRLRDMPENYIYFALHPRFKTSENLNATLEIEFYAPRAGMFDIQYDGDKWGDRPESIYSDTPVGIRFDPWPRWHRVALPIANARFQNLQNYRADFRLRVLCPEFYVRSVRLTHIQNASDPPPKMEL